MMKKRQREKVKKAKKVKKRFFVVTNHTADEQILLEKCHMHYTPATRLLTLVQLLMRIRTRAIHWYREQYKDPMYTLLLPAAPEMQTYAPVASETAVPDFGCTEPDLEVARKALLAYDLIPLTRDLETIREYMPRLRPFVDMFLGSRCPPQGDPPLVIAARAGEVIQVKALLQAGALVDECRQGESALLAAGRHGHVEVVKALLTVGASVRRSQGRRSGSVPETPPKLLGCWTLAAQFVALLDRPPPQLFWQPQQNPWSERQAWRPSPAAICHYGSIPAPPESLSRVASDDLSTGDGFVTPEREVGQEEQEEMEEELEEELEELEEEGSELEEESQESTAFEGPGESCSRCGKDLPWVYLAVDDHNGSKRQLVTTNEFSDYDLYYCSPSCLRKGPVYNSDESDLFPELDDFADSGKGWRELGKFSDDFCDENGDPFDEWGQLACGNYRALDEEAEDEDEDDW